uniref:hypothetical protein n=1 Tax=Alloprevotella sp. TaxID=1872471 RepID=UPI004026EE00
FDANFEHPTLQGATAPTRDTQGVASLALGYVFHWAFSPPLLNPKLELEYVTSIWFEGFSQCFYSVYCPIVGIVLLCCTILFVCKCICDASTSHREYLSVVYLNSSTWLFLKI